MERRLEQANERRKMELESVPKIEGAILWLAGL